MDVSLRLIATLAVGLGACSPTPTPAPPSARPTPTPIAASSDDFVQLLAAPAGQQFECLESLIVGELVVDPVSGTAIVEALRRWPVRWPPGYVARRVGAEIEVIGSAGFVVAVTGSRVTLDGGESPPGVWSTCAGLQ